MRPLQSNCLSHGFKDRFNKNGRILDAALRGFPVYLSECWFRIQVVCELGNIMTGKGGYDRKIQIQIQFSHSWEGTSCGEATCPAATWCSMPARQWMGFQVWASVPLIMWTFPAFPSIVWLRSGTNMKVENLRSVPTCYKIRWTMAELGKLEPDLIPKDPFRSAPHAKDVACSTLGQPLNELKWAPCNPLVWVIDSRID
jgi:hypothetical protein